MNISRRYLYNHSKNYTPVDVLYRLTCIIQINYMPVRRVFNNRPTSTHIDLKSQNLCISLHNLPITSWFMVSRRTFTLEGDLSLTKPQKIRCTAVQNVKTKTNNT